MFCKCFILHVTATRPKSLSGLDCCISIICAQWRIAAGPGVQGSGPPELPIASIYETEKFGEKILTHNARSAKRGIAIQQVVRLSVTVTLVISGRVGWVPTSKVITRIIRLWAFVHQRTNIDDLVQVKYTQNSDGIGMGSLFSAKNLQYR